MKRAVLMATMIAGVLTAGVAMAAITGSADVVTVSATPAAVSGAAGERVNFVVGLDISKTWHIYAHGDTNFIGVDLVPAEDFPLAGLKVDYPRGHEKEFFGEPVFMISGKASLQVSASIPEGLAAGEHTLQFGVTVQACDDKTCLAPVNVPVKITLKVKSSG